MSRKLQYNHGDLVGPSKAVYLKEVLSSGIYRKAMFRCGYCEGEFEAEISRVHLGSKKSCGCLCPSSVSSRPSRKTHGGSQTKLYAKYKEICHSGEEVSPEWLSDFTVFKSWAIANGYEQKKVICRKDKRKGFCPENCIMGKSGEQNKKHGESKSNLYQFWFALKRNCKRKRICIDAAWEDDFEVFRDWAIANNYVPGWQIERYDHTKGFTPENSYFQSFSKSTKSCWLHGERMTFSEAARKLGKSREAVRLYSIGRLKNIPEGLSFVAKEGRRLGES
jgi:hypothetical protein